MNPIIVKNTRFLADDLSKWSRLLITWTPRARYRKKTPRLESSALYLRHKTWRDWELMTQVIAKFFRSWSHVVDDTMFPMASAITDEKSSMRSFQMTPLMTKTGTVVATTRELMPFSNERDIAVKVLINKSSKDASNPFSFSSCSFNLYILWCSGE